MLLGRLKLRIDTNGYRITVRLSRFGVLAGYFSRGEGFVGGRGIAVISAENAAAVSLEAYFAAVRVPVDQNLKIRLQFLLTFP
jgi:hypothetical protein